MHIRETNLQEENYIALGILNLYTYVIIMLQFFYIFVVFRHLDLR